MTLPSAGAGVFSNNTSAVTPEGDCNGLFVTGKTKRGFSVRELHGGRSTLAFDYRVVGNPFATGGALPRPAILSNVRFAHRLTRSAH